MRGAIFKRPRYFHFQFQTQSKIYVKLHACMLHADYIFVTIFFYYYIFVIMQEYIRDLVTRFRRGESYLLTP